MDTQLTPEKLIQLRTEKGYSQQEVADLVGVSQRAYSMWERGESVPKYKSLMKLLEVLEVPTPAISSQNKEVVALGKHVPLRITADQYSEAFGDWKGLPMFNTPVTASFVELYKDEKAYQPQYYLHDPRFKDCDFGAIITGDSMHSEIRHGDFIACQEVKDRRFLVFGDIYYVVATNGLETCKYVNADPKSDDNILLVPKNPNISASPLPKEMILRMYKVRGIIRGY